MAKLRINLDELPSGDNHEYARLASVYAMPAHLRSHDTSGDQLPRHFPREHDVEEIEDGKERVAADAASHGSAPTEVPEGEKKPKMRKLGLEAKLWNPMEGEFTPAKRIEELDTAIALLELEKKRLSNPKS